MKNTINVLIMGSMLAAGVQSFARLEIDERNEAPEVVAAECLTLHTPVLEKVASQCSVEEKAPAHCFKVEKIQKTVDMYRIPSHSVRKCTITDEKGTHPCDGACGCQGRHAEKGYAKKGIAQ